MKHTDARNAEALSEGLFHASEATHPIHALPSHFQRGEKTHAIYHLRAQSLDYSDDYFLKEYKNQYGRTYLEDEANLRALARRRLARLRRHVAPPARLLELGCATGFFLDEARKLGYEVSGSEISHFASSYAKERLGLEVLQGPLSNLPESEYDVLVACYVLEHIPEQARLFEKLSRMLKKGGVLYFALPSSRGPLFEFSPERWAQTHPVDHFADYDPHSLKRVLALYGMRLLRCFPASFHQERSRGWKRILPESLYRLYARSVCYGDTFEGMALRI